MGRSKVRYAMETEKSARPCFQWRQQRSGCDGFEPVLLGLDGGEFITEDCPREDDMNILWKISARNVSFRLPTFSLFLTISLMFCCRFCILMCGDKKLPPD